MPIEKLHMSALIIKALFQNQELDLFGSFRSFSFLGVLQSLYWEKAFSTRFPGLDAMLDSEEEDGGGKRRES